MIKKIHAISKLLLFIFCIVTYFLVTIPLYPFYLLKPNLIRKVLIKIIQFYSTLACGFMGINVISMPINHNHDKKMGRLIVCNHLSYLDILIICSHFPAAFVTSVEMRNTPFLGHLCRLAGCLFVDRKNKQNIGQEVAEITKGLKNGLDVVVFPEATSTNGREVLRFRKSLFQASIDSGSSVLPLCLNYRRIEGKSVNQMNRDLIFWYGDMTFFSHLWKFFNLKNIDVELIIADSIEHGRAKDCIQLANFGHEIVKSNFIPVEI
ncbi:MAG: hypothetical protein Fur0010_11500 [Bdellovibrio sp.]